MITFTRTRQAVDEATGQVTPTVTTVTGAAIQVRGIPQRYAALGLTLATMPTLFFTPTDYNLAAGSDQFVLPGDVTTWAGQVAVARDVDPIAPDGVVIAARIVVSA
jgi:hypothetical protein